MFSRDWLLCTSWRQTSQCHKIRKDFDPRLSFFSLMHDNFKRQKGLENATSSLVLLPIHHQQQGWGHDPPHTASFVQPSALQSFCRWLWLWGVCEFCRVPFLKEHVPLMPISQSQRALTSSNCKWQNDKMAAYGDEVTTMLIASAWVAARLRHACTGVCAYSLLHQQGCRSRILSWKSLILRNMWGFAADLGDSSAKRFVSHLRSKIAATACVVVNAACPMALFRLVEGCMLKTGAEASQMASSPASTKPESACRNGIDKLTEANATWETPSACHWWLTDLKISSPSLPASHLSINPSLISCRNMGHNDHRERPSSQTHSPECQPWKPMFWSWELSIMKPVCGKHNKTL